MHILSLDVNALIWRLAEKKCTAQLPTFFHLLSACEKSPDASCTIKQERLAAMVGVSKATVSRSLTKLEQEGIIFRSGPSCWIVPMDDQEVRAYSSAMALSGWQAVSARCVDQEGVRWRQEWQADDVQEVYTASDYRFTGEKFCKSIKNKEKNRKDPQRCGDPDPATGAKLIGLHEQHFDAHIPLNVLKNSDLNAAHVNLSATDHVTNLDRIDLKRSRSCRSATEQESLIGEPAVIPTRARERGREAPVKSAWAQVRFGKVERSEANKRPSQGRLRKEAMMGETPLDEYRIRHQDPKGRFDDLYEIEHLSSQIALQYGLDLEKMRRTPFGNPRKVKLMERVTQMGGKEAVLEFLEWALQKAFEEADWLDVIGWNLADMYLIHSKGAVREFIAMKESKERAALLASRPAPQAANLPPENVERPARRAGHGRIHRPAEQATPTMAQPIRKGSIEAYRGGALVPVPIELLRLDDDEFIDFFKRPEFLRLPHDPHQGNMLFGWLIRPAAEQPMSFEQWVFYLVDMRRRYAGMIAFDHAQHRASRCGCEACYYYRAHADTIDRLLQLPVSWRQKEAIAKTSLDDDLFEPEDYEARGLDPQTRHYTIEDRRRMDEAARAWRERGAVLWEDARLNRPPI